MFFLQHVLYFSYTMEKCEIYVVLTLTDTMSQCHTHVFPPRNEPKRMYNAISPFVGFVVLTIMHILVLGGQKPPCYYFL